MSKIAGKTAHAVNQFFINLRQKMGTDAHYRIFKTLKCQIKLERN